MEDNEKDLEEQLMQALAGFEREAKKDAPEVPTIIIGADESEKEAEAPVETPQEEVKAVEPEKETSEEVFKIDEEELPASEPSDEKVLDPIASMEQDLLDAASSEVVDDTEFQQMGNVSEEDVNVVIGDLDEDEPAQFTGKEIPLDAVEEVEKKVEKTRRNRNQPTAEDLHKESVRFWVFTGVVAVLVIAAVIFILYSRGMLSNLFNSDNETKESSNVESESVSESALESESASQSETESTSESAQEEDKESVLQHYENIFIFAGENVLRVRKEPSTDAKIIGTLEVYAGGTILEQSGDWYHVQSGGIDGFVKADLVKTREDAKKLAVEHCEKRVISNSDTLNVREKPSTEADSKVLVTVTKGTNFAYLGEEGNFYKVKYGENYEGYVSKDFTNYGYYLKEAIEYFE